MLGWILHSLHSTFCSVIFFTDAQLSVSGLRFDEDYKHRMLTKRERPSIHGFYKIGKIIGDGNFAVVRECRHRYGYIITDIYFSIEYIIKHFWIFQCELE